MAIWVLALIVVVPLGVLWAAEIVGDWVLLVGPGILLALSLMRYRVEAEQKRRNADDEASK